MRNDTSVGNRIHRQVNVKLSRISEVVAEMHKSFTQVTVTQVRISQFEEQVSVRVPDEAVPTRLGLIVLIGLIVAAATRAPPSPPPVSTSTPVAETSSTTVSTTACTRGGTHQASARGNGAAAKLNLAGAGAKAKTERKAPSALRKMKLL